MKLNIWNYNFFIILQNVNHIFIIKYILQLLSNTMAISFLKIKKDGFML